MPRADDLEQFLHFFAQAAAQQMQQQEEEEAEGQMQPGEMQQEQQQPQQSEMDWQTERMQPEGEEAAQSSRIARLHRQLKLSDADIAALCAQWRRDQSSKLGKSQLSSSFSMQKPESMRLKTMQLKLQGWQPAIPVQSYPPLASSGQGLQQGQSQMDEGGESEFESGAIPQLRVHPFRVSLFMQRVYLAAVANAMQPFAAVTADMPVHLIGPSLLVDHAFVAKGQRGGGWGGEGQQGEQSVEQQQQPQQQQQPIQSSASSTFGAPFSVKPQQHELSGQQMKWQGQGLGSAVDSSSVIEIDPSDIDTQLDVRIAKAFAVTPADIAAPFEGGARSQFATSGQRPQSVHYEKEEGGVKIKWGSPMSFYPPSATIVSGDIQLRSAVLHITDLPVGLPASTSTALLVNGLSAFKAVAAAAGPQTADALDQSPGITIFVPQDSALSAIVRQLPQRQMQKLIRDVEKYKRKVNEMKKLAEKSQGQQSQSQSEYEGEGEGQYDSEFEQPQSQQQQQQHRQQDSQFSISSSPALDSMRWQSQHSPLRTKLGLLSPSSSMLRGRKLKLRGADVDSDLHEEESGAEGGDIEGGEQQRTAALAHSIAQLQQSAPLPFDLAKWCRQNGIEFDEEAARRGEAEGEEGEGKGAERASGLERPAGRRRLNKQQLAQFVQAHIVSGLVHSPDLAQLQSVTSVSGRKLSVQCGSASRTLMVGGANLIFTDILSKNAVIHVIDRPIGVKQQQQQTEQQTEHQTDAEFADEEGDQQQQQQQQQHEQQLGASGRALGAAAVVGFSVHATFRHMHVL